MYNSEKILSEGMTIKYGPRDWETATVYGEGKLKYQCREAADTAKLFNDNLDIAIAYLHELKKDPRKPKLEEYWYGYEDMEISLVWTRDETDEEYSLRRETELNYEKAKQSWAEEERKKKIALAKIAKIKKEAGLS